MSVDVSWILSNGQSRVHMQYRSSSLRSNADRHRQTIDFDKQCVVGYRRDQAYQGATKSWDEAPGL